MKKATSSTPIDDLNKKVHDLNYLVNGKPAKTPTKPDVEHGKELAKKIKENIRAYQNEASSQQPTAQPL